MSLDSAASGVYELWREADQPYYRSHGNEIQLFETAYRRRLPVLLKGPTGCGKTRFVRHMAWRLDRPLITVACHEDLTATDLVGRFLLKGGDTAWFDGPLTMGVRGGAIVYLDEIVEARKDIIVVIHPLADDRRTLTIEKLGEVLHAPAEFMLVASFNPGYQSALNDLKQSTRQRFVSIPFDYPEAQPEVEIIVRETNIELTRARRLVAVGTAVRRMVTEGLKEGASTRTLVYAATLIQSGVPEMDACRAAIAEPITDDPDLLASIQSVFQAEMG